MPQADVVIGSSPHLFAALAGLRLAHRWRVPFVLEVRDLWPESLLAAGGRKGPAYYVLKTLARYLYRRADRIICLARGTMQQLEKYGVPARKLVYVPNGADTTAFARTAIEAETRDFTLIYAGAHGPANGLDVVLEAARLLSKQTGIRFVLIGDGPAKPELIASAKTQGLKNVEFRDPVAKDQIAHLFRSADAGLMVLRDEPLFTYGVSPNKLFDYFASALPVVCNVSGEVADMLRRAGGGEQADDGSASALAAAVLRMRERSSNERAAMGRSARQWVEQEHSRPVLAARLDHALRELVDV